MFFLVSRRHGGLPKFLKILTTSIIIFYSATLECLNNKIQMFNAIVIGLVIQIMHVSTYSALRAMGKW